MSEFLVLGDARHKLDLTTVPIGGKSVLAAKCLCGRYSRLGDKRAVWCPECGLMLARVGGRIAAVRFQVEAS